MIRHKLAKKKYIFVPRYTGTANLMRFGCLLSIIVRVDYNNVASLEYNGTEQCILGVVSFSSPSPTKYLAYIIIDLLKTSPQKISTEFPI